LEALPIPRGGLLPGEFPCRAVRCGGEPRFIRGNAPGYARSAGLRGRGKVKADIELQPLSTINQMFDRLDQGDVVSRVVLDFNAG